MHYGKLPSQSKLKLVYIYIIFSIFFNLLFLKKDILVNTKEVLIFYYDLTFKRFSDQNADLKSAQNMHEIFFARNVMNEKI